MSQILVSVLGVLILGLATLAARFVGGMRTRWPSVFETIRRLNRTVFDAQQMATAGTPGAFAGSLLHTGRTSGKAYQTPLGIVPIDDGFVIAMVYGDRTEWSKNVLAAGTATVVHEGETYALDRPEILPISDMARRIIGCRPVLPAHPRAGLLSPAPPSRRSRST